MIGGAGHALTAVGLIVRTGSLGARQFPLSPLRADRSTEPTGLDTGSQGSLERNAMEASAIASEPPQIASKSRDRSVRRQSPRLLCQGLAGAPWDHAQRRFGILQMWPWSRRSGTLSASTRPP